MVDHTLLKPEAAPKDIEKLCMETLEYGFACACVNSMWVERASGLLSGSSSLVCSVIGFPLGASVSMAEEAEKAAALGAGELDMVIPLGLLKGGDLQAAEEKVRQVVNASSGVPVKVILETCLLTDDEKKTGCRIAMDAGAAWVKTSTGFSSAGARVEDVSLMKREVGDRLGVKASGGIRTLEDALAMIEAGASRLGCSRSVSIVESVSD